MTEFSTSKSELQPPAGTLTARERLLRALRGQSADRVPAWMMRQAGRYLPEYREVRRKYGFLALCKTPKAAAEVSIQPLKAIGTDAVIIFNDILIPLEHAGAQVEFNDQGPLIRNPIRQAPDLVMLKALASRKLTAEEPVARTIREVRRRVGEEVPILGFIGAPWTLATYWVEGRVSKQFESIGSLRFRDPALLDALLERITPIAAEYLKIQIEAGADAVQIFDTWGSILSQDEYARFSAPWIRRIIETVKPLGAPIIVYVNGCAPYLDQLAALGADAISVDWRVEMRQARQALPAQIALQGNLDPLVLLAGPEAAERAVRQFFEKFPPAPGHVFNLGHGILPNTPVPSARQLMEAVKRYGAY
jgi:uroporphyrinogen decarboxylase